MLSTEFDPRTVRQQLEVVLASASFIRSERLSSFLRFVVERHLEGPDSELKESVIAVEVFGRNADYDPKLDSIVRTDAGRLRARLAEYYGGEGNADPVVIELPKGGYVPLFRKRELEQKAEANAKPASRRLAFLVGVVVIVVVLAVIVTTYGRWFYRKSGPIAIAVLPLQNLSPNPDEYLADGLTDEIIRNLSLIDGLVVRSHTSSFAFKGKTGHVQDIGKLLNVDYILEGSILSDGQKLRANTQFIRVRDDVPLWSGSFDRDMRDIFSVQGEIAASIGSALRLKLSVKQRRYTDNLQAYQLYLRGRYALERPHLPGNALRYFEAALANDPNYALAYAGIADALLAMHADLLLSHSEAYPRAKAAAEKAVQLDPMLSEAHTALAMINAREEYAWQEAERGFRRAIELNPSNALAHLELGIPVLVVQGKLDEGIEEIRRSLTLDPLSSEPTEQLATALLLAGRDEESIDQARKAIKLDPTRVDSYLVLGRALYSRGSHAEAVAAIQEADRRSPGGGSTGWLACADVRAGRRHEAMHILQENLRVAHQKPAPARRLVQMYSCLGDKDQAFEYLEKMYTEHQPGLPLYFRYPELSWMRSDPRFEALRQRVGVSPVE